MRHRGGGLAAAGIVLFLLAWPAIAHHPISAKFAENQPLTLTGRVTDISWANPHVHIFIDVQSASGIANWAIELESTIDLRRAGWNRNSVKPGDEISVQGIAARDGTRQVWARSMVLTGTGKKVFDIPAAALAPPARGNQPPQPTPRHPDGQPRLGPVPGQTGYWGFPSSTVLVEDGVKVAMDAYGLLRNMADVDKVAPFERWARDLYEYRQRNGLKDDPTFLTCKPPGGPRQFQHRYGVQFVEDRDRKRIFVFIGSGNRNFRIMYTDGREQKGQVYGDYDNPLYYGRSVARWEKDTLVVDTKGFNDKFWFTNGGLPHTDQLHLIERFTRTDFHTLRYQVTIDDPGAYTRTWSSSWTMQWVAGEDLPVYYCQDNRS
jgi:hypothetical protein